MKNSFDNEFISPFVSILSMAPWIATAVILTAPRPSGWGAVNSRHHIPIVELTTHETFRPKS